MDLEVLIQRVTLEAAQFHRGMAAIEADLRKADRASTQTATRMRSGFAGVVPSIMSVRTAIASLASALAVREVIQYADAYTRVQNSLKVAGVSTGNLAIATTALFDVANRVRAPVEGLAVFYQQMSLAAGELDASQQQMLQVTEIVGQSLLVSGTDAQAAAGGLRQLAQALGSGRVEAEEFVSVLDAMPALARAMANNIDGAAGSVSRLREMIKLGAISSPILFKAILDGASEIGEQFARTEATVSSAFTVVRNALIELTGSTDDQVGATSRLADALLDLAAAMRAPEFQEFAELFGTALVEDFARAASAITVVKGWVDAVGTSLSSIELPPWIEVLIAQLGTLIESLGLTEEAVRRFTPDIWERAFAPGTDAAADFAGSLQQLHELSQQAGPLELPGGVRPTPPPTGTKTTTFQDIIGPLQQRLELLQQTEYSEDRISEIISAQGRMKRDLTTAEREALIEVNAAVDAETEARDAAEERAAASKDLTTTLQEQIEDAQLLASFGGEESEQYRIQLGLLAAKRAIEGEITDLSAEQLRLIEAAARAETRAQASREMTSLRQRAAQARFETGQAREAGTADIFGLPPSQDFFAEQERFRLQQANLYNGSMEPLIADLAAAQQQFQLMNETAPEIAGTLAELGQIAVFEGLEEAGQAFIQMLTEMLFQAIALQIVMAALGLASPTPTGITPTPGGGMGASGWGGPRQHGGSVRRGSAYLVGEAGPELFVPGASGAVMPNSSGAGGGGVVVNVINNAPGTEARSEEKQDGQGGGARIDVMVDEMVANNLRPGTRTSKALRDRFGMNFQTRR